MYPYFLLKFGTDAGRVRIFRIQHADESMQDDGVRMGMNLIIDSNAVAGPSGRLVTRRSASIVRTHLTPIDIG